MSLDEINNIVWNYVALMAGMDAMALLLKYLKFV